MNLVRPLIRQEADTHAALAVHTARHALTLLAFLAALLGEAYEPPTFHPGKLSLSINSKPPWRQAPCDSTYMSGCDEGGVADEIAPGWRLEHLLSFDSL